MMTVNDLEKSYKLSANEAWILVHDANYDEVRLGVDKFVKSKSDIVYCGIYGEQTILLHKENNR